MTEEYFNKLGKYHYLKCAARENQKKVELAVGGLNLNMELVKKGCLVNADRCIDFLGELESSQRMFFACREAVNELADELKLPKI